MHREAAQKYCFLLRKRLDFRARGHQNPSKIDPQTHQNAKLEAKITRKTILEAVETDFGGQDSDFGGQESDFGGQNGGGEFYMRTFGRGRWNGGGPLATPRVQRVQLEYRKIPYAGHP